LKSKHVLLISTLVIAAGVLLAPVAGAQTQGTSGNVQGVVSDPDGAPLPGVTVTVTSTETGRVRTTVTSVTGTYRVPLLPPGFYNVVAELAGFQTVERDDVRVSLGGALEVNLQLQLEGVQEVLIVTGQAPIVETTKTQVSSTIGEEAIDSLPILGRNFTDFTLLTPGAMIEGSRNTVSLSGQRGVNTAVNVDGTSNNSAFFGYQRGGTDSSFTISQESVQEFQVITSGIMPEFGRSGGGLVNVVTKSGTNQWRGGAHFYARNESFVANDPFDREQAEFHSYQFGGSVGGPIVKNESFIFASADLQDFSTPYFVDYGLSDSEMAELTAYVNQYRPEWDIRQTRYNRTNDQMVIFGKWDQSLGDNNQLSVRVNYSDHETIGGGTDTNLQGTTTASQSSLGDQTEKTLSFVGQLTSILGDRAFNELRVQYATDNLDRLSNDLSGPDTDIRGPFVQLGRRFFMPIFVDEKKFQVQNNFSYLFDDHDIKAGFDIETDQTSEFFAGFAAGEYRFNSLDDFYANTPSFLLQSFGTTGAGFEPNFDVNQTVAGAYIQDSWRVSNELTVNFGLRWEGTFNPTPPGNPAIPDSQQIPDSLDGWQPRLGFAYSPDTKSVWRASAGLFNSRTPTLLFFNPYTSAGLPGQGVFFFFNGGNLDGQWPNVYPSLPAGVSADQEIYWFSPDFREARTLRVNAGYEREIIEDFSLGFSYIYARGSRLQMLYDNNLVDGGVDQFGRRIYVGYSNYHAAIIDFKKRFSNGWGAFGNYTYGVDKDNDSNERSASGSQITDIYNLKADYGWSDRSIKHRVVVTGYGDLPLGFKLAGTFTWRTGQPYNGTLRNDVNGDNEDNDRPVINGRVIERNAFRQPDFKNVDIRVTKAFTTGAGRFDVFLEVFNLFNWSNLYTTQTNYDTSRFGDLNTFIGNVRQMQLGLRWVY